MTLYLKYRPQKVSELDLISVRNQLAGILRPAKDHPHAFLFTGPRGVGKTSSARILAKTLNCEKKKNGEPCNECDSCIAITTGTALDVVEIDAASNRGIDEIRDLREKIKLAPLSSKYKVYIIDEVHMLTNEAFNALLKTLEEPPVHAVFVLCTTEADKIPQTIVSRCTVVKFNRPKMDEIVSKLEQVSKGEDLDIAKKDLEAISQASKGSFRDAIKILEQIAVSGQSVGQVLGMLESADPGEFITHLTLGHTKEALKIVDQLVDQGANLRGFVERCVEQLRDQLLAGADVMDLIDEFNQAYAQMRESAVPQLPLEVMVVKHGKSQNKEDEPGREPTPKDEPDESEEEVSKASVAKVSSAISAGLGEVESKWTEVLKAVRPKNHSVEALLRSTRPIGFDGQKLMIEVFYKFHKDKLESEKCRNIIEEALGSVLGTDPVPVSLKLGQKVKREEISAEAIEDDIVKAAEEIFKVDAI